MIIAFLLSSKVLGYPLSILYLGPKGTGKTSLIESVDLVFKEPEGICEAGNSTIKLLIPSFRERPANPGYLLECIRIGLIDELFKMIAAENKQSQYRQLNSSYLGQFNMLLEHKRRTIGSGNVNKLDAQATAKYLFVSNPYSGKKNLEEHLKLIDDTTLSRMLIYVQDKEHQKTINEEKNNNTSMNMNKEGISKDIIINWENEELNPFLTIYDSCQEFLISMDKEKLTRVLNESSQLLNGSLKKLWEARGFHHLALLLDGIVKFRCIFRDYDSTFTPQKEDYQNLRKIIIRILNSWNTQFGSNGSD